MRFELTTLTLARLCSTPELRPRPWVGGEIESPRFRCKGKIVVARKIPPRSGRLVLILFTIGRASGRVCVTLAMERWKGTGADGRIRHA